MNKIKVLVIEDIETIRENILETLKAENFEPIEAENGVEGISLAKQHLPDLILCDVMMPEIDGYGVLQALQQDPTTATIPFIFLTALADRDRIRKGMELGADDYLTKPFEVQELLRAISTRLGKQATIKQQEAEKLEELRSNIAIALPHELRTPLNAILGFADLLLGSLDSLERDEIKEMVEDIKAGGIRLYRLIQNFLLYADLELIAKNPERLAKLDGDRSISAKPIIIAQATQQATKADREKDLAIELPDFEVCLANKFLVKIVEELLDNAFKFSVPGTPVCFLGQLDNHYLILSVSDRGRGMKPEQIASLGAYMQFERKLYEQQGSGLGLAICKRLAELHGGNLQIESILDRETTVRIFLPLSS
jgi:signal transduction histidine kinase